MRDHDNGATLALIQIGAFIGGLLLLGGYILFPNPVRGQGLDLSAVWQAMPFLIVLGSIITIAACFGTLGASYNKRTYYKRENRDG